MSSRTVTPNIAEMINAIINALKNSDYATVYTIYVFLTDRQPHN